MDTPTGNQLAYGVRLKIEELKNICVAVDDTTALYQTPRRDDGRQKKFFSTPSTQKSLLILNSCISS